MKKIVFILFSLFLLVSCNKNVDTYNKIVINDTIDVKDENVLQQTGKFNNEQLKIEFKQEKLFINYSIDNIKYNKDQHICLNMNFNPFLALKDEDFITSDNKVYLKCIFNYEYDINKEHFIKNIDKAYFIHDEVFDFDFNFNLSDINNKIDNFKVNIIIDNEIFKRENFINLVYVNKEVK